MCTFSYLFILMKIQLQNILKQFMMHIVTTKTKLKKNENNYTYYFNSIWRDLENAIEEVKENEFEIDNQFNKETKTSNNTDTHDLTLDLLYLQQKSDTKKFDIGFQIVQNPNFLRNIEYYKLRQTLNKEQEEIVKDIAMKNNWTKTNHYTFFSSVV